MKLRFPDLTFFLDAAGRYSHSKETPIVFAGVALETTAIEEVRESLLTITKGNLAKWSADDLRPDTARAVFWLLAKRQLFWLVRIIWKNTPEWDSYFEYGEKLYQKAVKNAQEAAPYAKPMNTFKLHQFGLASADLLGFYMGRHRRKLPPKDGPVESISVTTIHDSDIHGQVNQQVFRDVLNGIQGDLPRTILATRIKPVFDALIKTEEEEPLLLLPDYIAGYLYSRKAYGLADGNDKANLLTAVEALYEQIPKGCYHLLEEQFREKYLLPPTTFDHVLPKKERDALFEVLLGKKDSDSRAT